MSLASWARTIATLLNQDTLVLSHDGLDEHHLSGMLGDSYDTGGGQKLDPHGHADL